MTKTLMTKILLLALATTPFALQAADQPIVPTVSEQQVPGYYRLNVGDFQVTALYDGYVNLPASVFKGASNKAIKDLLHQRFVDDKNGIQTAVNAYLVNTGKQLILVDSGAAKCFGDRATIGSIQDNLAAAGYKPEQVNAVLLTHLHPDHACGISAVKGQKSFPNATIYVDKAEADFWLNPANLQKYPKEKHAVFKPAFDNVQQLLAPYKDSNQLKTYQLGDNIADGVTVVSSRGHTMGHASYLLSSKGQQLLVLGDVVHSHAIQFAQPSISFDYDYDAKQAVASRYKIFADAAKGGYLLAGAHLPFPGIGHVRAVGKQQFEWVPLEYSPVTADAVLEQAVK